MLQKSRKWYSMTSMPEWRASVHSLNMKLWIYKESFHPWLYNNIPHTVVLYDITIRMVRHVSHVPEHSTLMQTTTEKVTSHKILNRIKFLKCLNEEFLTHNANASAPATLLITWINLIPTWIRNHMSNKLWDEITYPFPNFSGCTVEVWKRMINFILHFVMDIINSPYWD